MSRHTYLFLLFLIPNWALASDYPWPLGDKKLNAQETKDIETLIQSERDWIFGKILSTTPLGKNKTQFEIEIIHSFGKKRNSSSLKRVALKNEHFYNGQLLLIPVTQKLKYLGVLESSRGAFMSIQSRLGFSKDVGLDAWLTCKNDNDCEFVQTCSGPRSMNRSYFSEFNTWKSHVKGVACKKNTLDTHKEKYRSKCDSIGICGAALR